jgi:3-methyladenine DNA glycosylase AlkD
MKTDQATLVSRDLKSLPLTDATSVRSVLRKHTASLKALPPEDMIPFVRSLISGGGWPQHVVAWESLAKHRTAFSLVDDALVEEMADGLSDWPSIDLYGVTIVGPAWHKRQLSDRKILEWTRSTDRWRRRLALVATVPLNAPGRGGTGDAQRTLRICRILLDDRDDMVVKAMSWALRELTKPQPDEVEKFLEKESDRLAPRVKREVRNKLDTGLKSPSKRRTRKS